MTDDSLEIGTTMRKPYHIRELSCSCRHRNWNGTKRDYFCRGVIPVKWFKNALNVIPKATTARLG